MAMCLHCLVLAANYDALHVEVEVSLIQLEAVVAIKDPVFDDSDIEVIGTCFKRANAKAPAN